MYARSVLSSNSVDSYSLSNAHHSNSSASTMNPSSSENSNHNNPNLGAKQRLRWTNELHERFVDAVAQLGGPDSEFLKPQN